MNNKIIEILQTRSASELKTLTDEYDKIKAGIPAQFSSITKLARHFNIDKAMLHDLVLIFQFGQEDIPGLIKALNENLITIQAWRSAQILKTYTINELEEIFNKYNSKRDSQSQQKLSDILCIDEETLHRLMRALSFGFDYISTYIEVFEYPKAKLFVPSYFPLSEQEYSDMIIFENFQGDQFITDFPKGRFDELTNEQLLEMLYAVWDGRPKEELQVTKSRIKITNKEL